MSSLRLLEAECASLHVAPARLEGGTEAEEASFACPMAPAAADAD